MTQSKRLIVPFIITAIFCILSYLFWDRPIAEFAAAHQHAWYVGIAKYTNYLGNAFVYLVPIAFFLALSFAKPEWKHFRKPCYFILSVLIITGIAVLILKNGLGRARPYLLIDHAQYGFYFLQFHASHWSFPSGHTATVAGALVPLAVVCRKFIPVCLILVLVVMFSRIITLEHYLSDVVGSVFLVSAITYLLYPKFFSKKNNTENQ